MQKTFWSPYASSTRATAGQIFLSDVIHGWWVRGVRVVNKQVAKKSVVNVRATMFSSLFIVVRICQ